MLFTGAEKSWQPLTYKSNQDNPVSFVHCNPIGVMEVQRCTHHLQAIVDEVNVCERLRSSVNQEQ